MHFIWNFMPLLCWKWKWTGIFHGCCYHSCPGWMETVSSWLFPKVFLWLLNAVVVGVVLAKVLVYGEPVTRKNTTASVSYWRHRRQAEVDMERVSLFLCHLFKFVVCIVVEMWVVWCSLDSAGRHKNCFLLLLFLVAVYFVTVVCVHFSSA